VKMKRLWWYLKAGFLCASLFVLLGGYAPRVGAQDPLGEFGSGGAVCMTAQCEQSTTNQCFCTVRLNCSGCYIPNGESPCGTCR
jgi:hypothetical protein